MANVLDAASLRRFGVAVCEAIVALVFVGAVQFAIASYGVRPAVLDFRVVYCAERGVVRGSDPYRTEPLRTCEHTVKLEATEAKWAVTPFPLPGYAAAMLLPLAFLPFKIAKIAWLVALVLGFGVTAATVARLMAARAWLVALVFAPTLGYLDFTYGEPVNISVAFVALAALAVEFERPKLAAIAGAFAMIEPHIGLPACVALFFLIPGARVAITLAAVVLAGLTVATVGPGPSLEYFTTFLPLQALSEVYAVDQFSLTRVLYLAGIAPRTAIELGGVAYALAVAVGLYLARRSNALGMPRALVVLVPVATAMFGGSFVHDVEIVAALPAALVLARYSWLARGAVALLAMQWGLAFRGVIVLLTTSTFALLAIVADSLPLRRRVLYAFAIVAVVLVASRELSANRLSYEIRGTPPVAIVASTPSSIPWEWSRRLSAAASDSRPIALVIKFPLWIGLACVPLSFLERELALASARRRRAEPATT